MNVGLWLDNLLAYSLQVAALAVVGTVLPLVLRLRHPGVLLHYWRALFGACWLLPIIQPWRSLPVETFSLGDIGTVQIQTTFAVAADGPAFPSDATTCSADPTFCVGLRLSANCKTCRQHSSPPAKECAWVQLKWPSTSDRLVLVRAQARGHALFAVPA